MRSLHLKVDPLPVEVLIVVLLQLIKDALYLPLFLVLLYLSSAQMPCGPFRVCVDPQDRQVWRLYDTLRTEIGSITT